MASERFLVIGERGAYSDRETLAWYCTEEQARRLYDLHRAVQGIIRQHRYIAPDGERQVKRKEYGPNYRECRHLRYSWTDVRLIILVAGVPLHDDLVEDTQDGVQSLIEDYEGDIKRAETPM